MARNVATQQRNSKLFSAFAAPKFGTLLTYLYLCSGFRKNVDMEARTTNYTAQDWAEHEQFVQMFRAAKQRKRAWQQKMEVVLAEKAEKIRKRREEIDKLFEK